MDSRTLIAGIVHGDFDNDLDNISEAVRSRRKEANRKQAQINALTISPGARVVLKGLSPQYLNGITGEVVEPPASARRGRRGKARLYVKTDDPRARRYSNPLSVPANCVEAI